MINEKAVRDSADKTDILFTSVIVPDDVMEERCKTGAFAPIQQHLFCWSIVRGLETAFEKPIDILGLQPIETTWPRSGRFFLSSTRWKRDNGGLFIGLPILNLPKIRSVSVFFAMLFYTIWWCCRTRSHRRVIFQVSLNNPLFFATLICRLLFKLKIVLVVNDPPSDHRVKKVTFLQRFNHAMMFWSINKVDGLIGVTKYVAMDFAPKIPSMVIESIAHTAVTEEKIDQARREKKERAEFVFVNVGSLYEEYGVKLLIDAFLKVPNENVRLRIFGKGPVVPYIEEMAKNDPRIYYGGFVSNEEALRREMAADVLVNPRPSDQEFVRYSFPIKLMEYLSTGTATATTKLACIPEDYDGHYIPIEDETPEGLAALLEKLAATPRSELHAVGSKAARFIRENKTVEIQGKRMAEFIKQLL